MDGIESKLTSNVLKPASGFVDALLAPKIKKVKKWAQDREIATILEGRELGLFLERYLIRIINRSAELSTIVFPQVKIPLVDVYEPLFLKEDIGILDFFAEDMHENKNYVIDYNLEGMCYFIIDEAGMGKSTFSKNISLEIVGKTEKMPILFELNEYDTEITLIENLAKEFDELDSHIDRDVFIKLIAIGKFFIILDGFDELSSDAQSILKKEIKKLSEKMDKSSLLVTSRPQDSLPNLLSVVKLKLVKLNNKQAISILSKYDLLSGINVGERLIEELSKVPSRFLETPLLVSLLYRTFGFNNTIADKISVFYCEIFDALYKGHDLTKSGYVRNKLSCLDIDVFRVLLRALSFIYIAKSSEGNNTRELFLKLISEAKELCSLDGFSSDDYLQDLLVAVPLLTKEGTTFKFMHRTLAEYFAAEYIVNTDNSSELLKKIISGPSLSLFKETIEYIYEISPNIYRETITMPIAQDVLNKFPDKEISPLYMTNIYLSTSAISYWRLEDVSGTPDESGHRNIDVPMPEYEPSSCAYMYGDKNGEKFIVCICSEDSKTNFPDGAWTDLSTIFSSDEDISNDRVEGVNVSEIIDELNIGEWYFIDTDTIKNINTLNAIQEAFLRANTMVPKGGFDAEGARVISRDRCTMQIESIERTNRAKNNIDDLLAK